MPKNARQKLKTLYLAQILSEQTDEEHVLSSAELIQRLKLYGVDAERKSIYDDIEMLQSFGMDIEMRRGRGGGFYLASRKFELPELKLLVDAVQSSRFITHKKSNDLIRKIESLASAHQAKGLQRQVYVAGRSKTVNESIYYNVDRLHTAIHEGKQILFLYFEWTVSYDQGGTIVKRYRKDGADYRVDPWFLAWADENYYLIAYDPAAEKMKHYRVDKMENIRMTKQPRAMQKGLEQFDLGAYVKRNFHMFGGSEKSVTLRCENWTAGIIYDRFGSDCMIRKFDESHFEITVQVAVSPQFFSWIFGLGQAIKIVSPDEVAGEYAKLLSAALDGLDKS